MPSRLEYCVFDEETLIEVRLLQPEKTLPLINVTELGIVKLESPLQSLNADVDKVLMLVGSVIEVTNAQLSNAPPPIVVTGSPMIVEGTVTLPPKF